MTDRELELRLKKAVEAHTPDVLERVMSDCDCTKGQVVQMNEKKKHRFPRLLAAAAALVLVLGLAAFGISRMNAGGVASIVMLDVNPSIELKLDSNREVLEANPLNEDAARILDGMKLKGTDVNTAANAIIGSLLKNGYIDELANSILLSVEDADSARGEKLRTELTEEIDGLLKAASVNAAILAQTVADDSVGLLSQEYQISHGKAALIERIQAANPTYQMAELAELSVNELNLILSNPKNEVAEVTSTGSASQSAYIGAEKAIAVAMTHAGVAEKDTYGVEAEFDYEHGKLVYEVEFSCNGREYAYDIDAITGDVVRSHDEYDDDVPAGNTGTAGSGTTDKADSAGTVDDIGSEAAKAVALQHAGAAESAVTGLKVERDYDDGRLEYKVEFHVGNVEYEYEIAAADGTILEYDKDVDNDDSRPVSSNAGISAGVSSAPAGSGTSTAAGDIGTEKAKTIALQHAGFAESAVTGLRVERDLDDGRVEYSVEFRVGNVEYDYEIAAADGTILEHDSEVDD